MAENSVCVYSPMTYGFVTSAKKSVISARPLRMTKPTGCCMKEFATRIQKAERLLAKATIQMQMQWRRSESLSQPKIQMPRKVDSRKKAVSASSASGAPKISPMKREYSDQFMPKWNSCTIPVTTPIEKLMMKSELAASLFPGRALCADVARLEQCDEDREPECYGDKEKMVDSCDGELPSG